MYLQASARDRQTDRQRWEHCVLQTQPGPNIIYFTYLPDVRKEPPEMRSNQTVSTAPHHIFSYLSLSLVSHTWSSHSSEEFIRLFKKLQVVMKPQGSSLWFQMLTVDSTLSTIRTVKAVIPGTSETKGLPDIVIFQITDLCPTCMLLYPSNLMDRPNHFICTVTSCPVFPAALSIPLFANIYVTFCAYNVSFNQQNKNNHWPNYGILWWAQKVDSVVNLSGPLVNFH
jgi:hypothetical protein